MLISPLNISPLSNGGDGFSDLYSVLLDGTDEYINIDDVGTALAATTVGTWSMWIKPIDATPPASEILISFGDTNGNETLQLYITTNGKLNIFCRTSTINRFLISTDASAFSDGVWAHAAIVQDGTLPILYVNGAAVAQSTVISTDTTRWFATATALDNGRVGDRQNNSGAEEQHFNGNVNDILLTSDAKSAAEILSIYNAGKPKNEASITNGVSYFKIDSDIISTCVDSIGTNDGTYVNVEQADIELDTP